MDAMICAACGASVSICHDFQGRGICDNCYMKAIANGGAMVANGPNGEWIERGDALINRVDGFLFKCESTQYPTFYFEIIGRPISWKNKKKVTRNRQTGKPIIYRPKREQLWFDSAVSQLIEQKRLYKSLPIRKMKKVSMRCISYLGSKHLIDSSNLYQGPEDALQAAGVLEDDCCVENHNDSERRYDKEKPRVCITLKVFGER